MKITLQRGPSSEQGTFGILYHHGKPLCVTCENPWKNNQRYVSCIPTGTYQVKYYSSPKYPDSWELQKVSGRSKILIHAGNTTDDTSGCILPGKAFFTTKGLPAVSQSRDTMKFLKGYLPDQFTLEIRNGQVEKTAKPKRRFWEQFFN